MKLKEKFTSNIDCEKGKKVCRLKIIKNFFYWLKFFFAEFFNEKFAFSRRSINFEFPNVERSASKTIIKWT